MLNKKQIYFNLLVYNLLYRLKNKLIAISIPIFIFILYISINSFIQFPPILGQTAKPVNNINSIITNGNILAAQGNYNGAISLYDQVLAMDPNNIKALYNKGKALAKLGNYNGAISLYDKILAMDPNNRGALYNKGNALGKLGNYNGAISLYDKILSINSTDAKAAKNKADVQAKLGKQQGGATNIKLPYPTSGSRTSTRSSVNTPGTSTSSSVTTPGVSIRSSSNTATTSNDDTLD